MKNVLSLLARSSPLILKRIVVPAVLTFSHLYLQGCPKISCFQDPFTLTELIAVIESNTVRIEVNGRLIGQAYCFAQNHLVTVSHELQEDGGHHSSQRYQFYREGKKLAGKFTILGHFQNLTFIECSTDTVKALPCEEGDQPFMISQVQTFKAGDYPSIKGGYLVAQDSGFGVIDGLAQIGGLVLSNGKAKGIITQIGKERESGFSRMIEWKHLPNIMDSLKGKKSPYFGISAQAQESSEGLQVVRIAPNSPLRSELMMGDTILRANNYRVRDAEALQRIWIISKGSLTLQILREDSPMEVTISPSA